MDRIREALGRLDSPLLFAFSLTIVVIAMSKLLKIVAVKTNVPGLTALVS